MTKILEKARPRDQLWAVIDPRSPDCIENENLRAL